MGSITDEERPYEANGNIANRLPKFWPAKYAISRRCQREVRPGGYTHQITSKNSSWACDAHEEYEVTFIMQSNALVYP